MSIRAKVYLYIFLLMAWFAMVSQDTAFANIIYSNKCKLGVIAVSIPTTMALAAKIYKKDRIEFYRQQAEMQGRKITLDECEDLYEENYTYRAFFKAYQGYLKRVFTGSKEFKKEKAAFCYLVKGLYVAFLGATAADYLLQEETEKKDSADDVTQREIDDLLSKRNLTQEEKQKIEDYEKSKILKFFFSCLGKTALLGLSAVGGIKLFL